MRHILQWIFVFAAALASVFTLQSCGLEEPFPGPQSGISEGTVEFVARPAGYNNHDVTTKADGNPSTFEDDEIHNAFLLVFNEAGQRLLCEEINLTTEEGELASEYGQLSVKIDRSLGNNVNACILANVPVNFARGITGLESLNAAVLDLSYDKSKSGVIGVPVLDLDSNSATPPVPCIPMYGPLTSINLTSAPATVQVELKRLFAKISVKLTLDVEFTGFQETIQTYTHYQLNHWKLYNIPTKVRLVENNSESDWVDGKGNLYVERNIQIQSEDLDENVYNTGSTANLSKMYEFYFYVPEFYLHPIESITDDQRYKPKNYDNRSKYPIYIELVGQYNEYAITSTNINYDIFLGGDPVSNYSLARNTHYTNLLTITGTSQNVANNLDHRVTTTTINNPVAKEGKSANCYVINTTGEYFFPAYKGAYNDLTKAELCNSETASELVILANSNYSGITIDKYSYDPEKNIISFHVENMDNGNVVLGLMNKDGSLEWSWHLWFNEETVVGDWGWGEFENQIMPDDNGSMMMDRNIGSSPSAQSWFAGSATGTYYKYGNRAPFFTDDRPNGNGRNYHGYTPEDTHEWNTNEKSKTDPCPPGYRVPPASVWDSEATNEHAELDIFGYGYIAFRYWNNNTSSNTSDDIYYPYSEYLVNQSGDLHESEKDMISDYKYTSVTDIWVLTTYNVRIKYKEKYSILRGVLLANDYAIDYHTQINEIASDKVLQYKRKNQDWSKATDVNLENIKKIPLLGDALNSAANSLIESIAISDIYVLENNKSINNYHAAQVRCVKEDTVK